ncbi:MAG TPA: rhomboid family intramembrane serine protease [Spirochaetia bacterium]|nr:rhomboid family intramembrane serine protease [Spirochaetia bacterium]
MLEKLKHFRLPAGTATAFAATSVVFILMTVAGGPANLDVLLAFGASCQPYFLAGEYWRAVMPMFLHLSLVHLFLNLYALCLFGPELERLCGCGVFALIYVSAGTAGSLGSMLMTRRIGAGASGAVLGICGALFVTRYQARWVLSENERAFLGRPLVLTVLATLVFGWIVPGIDNWAHISGLLAGSAVRWFLRKSRQYPDVAGAGLLRAPLMIALTTVCLAASATIDRYPVLHRVNMLNQVGEESFAKGDRVHALSDFREAERLEPADFRPHLELSSIYSSLGRERQTREECDWAARLEPEVTNGNVKLGVFRENTWK